MTDLRSRLGDAVAGTVLAERLPTAAAPLLEARADDDASGRLSDGVCTGLARAIATQPDTAVFLSHRPRLFERLAAAGEATLDQRARELHDPDVDAWASDDLEADLDALRLLRREDTLITACLDLGGVASFAEVSRSLSLLAETVTRRALSLAFRQVMRGDPAPAFAVVGMGKIAGREFTYHSDLDLIFLCDGPPEALARAARIGQRLISYLSMMTGAGVAYAVDTRLRPSGGQGVLVTSFDGFDRYQREQAELWEHVALLRARAIAGRTDAAQQRLDHAREPILRAASEPWSYLADLRRRVEDERARVRDGFISLKTGPGGLMDVDFLAAGGLLELPDSALPPMPSVPGMLEAAIGAATARPIGADYAFVRQVESRARWIAGRAVEQAECAGEGLEILAALVQPGEPAEAVADALRGAQARIRERYDAVVAAGSIRALDAD